MIALFISILLSLSTASADAKTSTTKEGSTTSGSSVSQTVTTFGGSTTWAEGTH